MEGFQPYWKFDWDGCMLNLAYKMIIVFKHWKSIFHSRHKWSQLSDFFILPNKIMDSYVFFQKLLSTPRCKTTRCHHFDLPFVPIDDHVREFQYKHVTTWEDNFWCAQVSYILIRLYTISNIRTLSFRFMLLWLVIDVWFQQYILKTWDKQPLFEVMFIERPAYSWSCLFNI